ncbi:MAG: aminopeptidase [Hyphococcus sp.]|nr:MAG: aminopeptidase [Marinicaulis sp.]
MRSLLIASLTAIAATMTTGCDEIRSQMNKLKTDAPAASTHDGANAKANKNRLEADVRYLADDLLEGREAGTRGYDLAAKYVAENYRAIGLTPGGNDGTYYQEVPMREDTLGSENGGTLTLTGANAPQDIEPAVDYFVGSTARETSGSVEAPLVFVGYGLVAEDYNRDDFAGLDVEGKIVVAMFGSPKFLNTEERAHYRSTLAKRASDRGAVGMIVLFTPDLAKLIPVPNPFEYLVGMQRSDSSMSWLEADGTPHSNAPNFRGGAFLSPALSERFFENQPVSWEDIVAAEASEMGEIQGFDMNMTARIEHSSNHRELTSPNVIGILPGSDPQLKDEYIVLTAHLDHDGIKPTPEEGDDELFNGAMDNATGTASIMEVARLLSQNPPKRSVMFVALTAEEKGLVGSDYNARNPTVPAEQVVANVNLDMPILTWPFTDVVAFGAERSTMYPIVEAAVARAGLTLTPDPQPEQGFFVRSDQYSYVKQGVPAVYLDLGFGNGGEEAQTAFQKDHYHKPSDEVEHIDFEQLRRFAQVNYEIADGVANMETRPLWKKDDFFARIFNGPMEE